MNCKKTLNFPNHPAAKYAWFYGLCLFNAPQTRLGYNFYKSSLKNYISYEGFLC